MTSYLYEQTERLYCYRSYVRDEAIRDSLFHLAEYCSIRPDCLELYFLEPKLSFAHLLDPKLRRLSRYDYIL